MKVLCNVVWEKVGGGNLGRESAEEELGGVGGVGRAACFIQYLVRLGINKEEICVLVHWELNFVSLQGLIKIRGDQCWRDLTCMNYHYEVSSP